MERILRGKFLVRKSKLSDGKEVVILSGIFHPINFEINTINDNDEMWVSDIIVSSAGIRYTDPIGVDGGSPEDFISGVKQLPEDWKTRGHL
jgi:hypothetical protein